MAARSLPRGSIIRKGHDMVALRVHWKMCRKCGIECTHKWYDHQSLPIAENGEMRITWDSNIYSDKVLTHNRPEITLVHKDTVKDYFLFLPFCLCYVLMLKIIFCFLNFKKNF